MDKRKVREITKIIHKKNRKRSKNCSKKPCIYEKLRLFYLEYGGVNIMAEDNKSCRGCVCLTCQYSEQNGDFNRCPFKSCRLCTDTVHHIRSICDKGVQLPKKADYADFVL